MFRWARGSVVAGLRRPARGNAILTAVTRQRCGWGTLRPKTIRIMDRAATKRAVLKAARTRLENTAAELKARIEELRAVTIGDDNAESASQTESTRGGDVDLMNSLSMQLEHVLQDIDRLAIVAPDAPMDSVQFGAVVHTDHRNLLVGFSLEEFDAGGRRYLGVTPKAPLVQALYGRKVGDSAVVNGVAYTVQEIC